MFKKFTIAPQYITGNRLSAWLEVTPGSTSAKWSSSVKWLMRTGIIIISLAMVTCVKSQNLKVHLTEEADCSAGSLPCYKITTVSATYYLEKEGLGLSSMIDPDGNDWISFDPEPGTGPAGEYRGFPNAIHKQDDSFFHPMNQGTSPSTSEVITNTDELVSIKGISGNGNWECTWDFYPTHCVFTMTKMPNDYGYWVLYEGTPGGSFELTDWWMTSAINTKQAVTVDHEGDIPDPEWVAFGDDKAKYSIFLVNHQDDKEMDNFFQMKESMTVFGFGREHVTKFLTEVPRSVSIGFVESDQHQKINDHVLKLIME